MTNKICVYAICKNESKFVKRWVDSMSEADYIVVLDTGSTDGTYEMLKADPRVTRVEQKIFNPWRFDVARNESIKLVPSDANILACIDLDEVFEPGWAEAVRQQWNPSKHTRGLYKYAYSHNDNGEPSDIYYNDKFHTRKYHWIYPVHEVLNSNTHVFDTEVLRFEDNVYLHHFPDKEKSRSFYYDLLLLRRDENPEDFFSQYLIAREYGLMEDYDKSLEEFYKLLNMPETVIRNDMVMVSTYGLMADIYKCKRDYAKAIEYYSKMLQYDPTYREPYLCLAELYLEFGLYNTAKAFVIDSMDKTYQHFDWAERKDTYYEKPYDIISIADYYLDLVDEGIVNAEMALRYAPNNERIQKNYQALLIKKEQQSN